MAQTVSACAGRCACQVMNGDQQKVPFSSPVKAVNNIEDWLCELLKKMQITMKVRCPRPAALIIMVPSTSLTDHRSRRRL